MPDQRPDAAGNQPGGPQGPGLDYKNGSRGTKSGMNVEDNRAVGVPPTPVKPQDAGQLPDPDAR